MMTTRDLILAALVAAVIAAGILLLSRPADGSDADAGASLWGRLGAGTAEYPGIAGLDRLDPAGWPVSPGEILFPRPELAAQTP